MEWQEFQTHLLQLGAAAGLGGILGFEREFVGHWAGFRTHMMVSLGACLFLMIGEVAAADDPAQLSRVVQGVATGVGFLGAGTILKLTSDEKVKGLTTAASIWLAASVGAGCALDEYPMAIAATCLAVVILAAMRPVEWLIERSARRQSLYPKAVQDADSPKQRAKSERQAKAEEEDTGTDEIGD